MSTSPSTDPMHVYLEQIGRHPLLGPLEEARLARAAQAVDASACRRRVESNLRLVVSIVRRYGRSHVDQLDLIQEGNIGLMTAAERFDPLRGVRFATYAGWWIRSSIRRAALAESGPIRLPDRVLEAIVRVRDAERELKQRLRRTPTRAEIARESGLSEESVDTARRAARPPASLHETLPGDGDLPLADLIEDERGVDAAARMADDDELAALATALDSLEDRSGAVVALHFGIGGDEPATLGDAGRMRLSRERVRQLECRALRDLSRDPALQAGALAA